MSSFGVRRTLARVLERVDGPLERGQDALADAARTTRFLRGRLEFSPREDDIYVATYPRSGTTWLQFILYLLSSDRSCNFEHISVVSPWFERTLALGTRQARDFESLPSPRIFKSHLPRRWLPAEGRFIYVERDGRDVAASYFRLYQSQLGYRGDFSSFFDRFLRGEVQYRSWFKHVAGWKRHRDQPEVLWLRYEDFLSDRRAQIERIALFCGLERGLDHLDEVVEKSGRDFMKSHEDQFDPITETLIDRGLRRKQFIGQGVSGHGESQLSDAQLRQFEALASQPVQRADLELDIPAFLH